MKKAKEILKKLNLRPTLQRLAITEILLKKKEFVEFKRDLILFLGKNKIFISNRIPVKLIVFIFFKKYKIINGLKEFITNSLL
jgi:hypothetical protein